MKTILSLAFLMLASQAHAGCIGSGSLQTCYDAQSGNSYTINRMGNFTTMQGSNARTGSTWSQQSNTFGNTTIHNGFDSDGDSWSSTCINGICN